MNKKVLIVIIVILALILVAAIAGIFLLDPTGDNQVMPTVNDTVQETDPTQGEEADAPAQETAGQQTPAPEDEAPVETAAQEQTEATEPTEEETDPEEDKIDGPIFEDVKDVEAPDSDKVTYMEYHSMSASEQKAFINSFGSYDAFFEWLDQAKAEYEDSLVEIDGSGVNAEDIVGGD